MKKLLLLYCLALPLGAFASSAYPMPESKANQIANAIFKIENSKKYPYGIKSVKTSNPRKVCINTIKNNYIRWQKSGKKGDFLNYLADVYCPKSCDPVGNANWKKNIHILNLQLNLGFDQYVSDQKNQDNN